MSDALLSILTPTLLTRSYFMDRLRSIIEPQAASQPIVLLTDLDNGERNIGAKRQALLEAATTPYVAFVDDDDLVSPDYAERICAAIRDSEPDVVGFRVRKFVNGKLHTVYAYTRTCPQIPDLGREYRYVRRHRTALTHLNPIRTDIARAIGFKPWNTCEDGAYATELKKQFPDLRETFIAADLYDYLLRTDRAGEVTNATRTT